MNRIHLAGYSLLASAFVLAAMLIVQIDRKGISAVSEAEAGMVLSKGSVSMLTAETRSDEESVFIIENSSETMLIYLLDLQRKEMNLEVIVDLAAAFGRNRANFNNNSNQTQYRPR